MADEPELTIDQITSLFSDLTFIKKIGRGGQKQVFLASDSSSTKVVVKLMQIDYFWDNDGTVMRNVDVETRARREIKLIEDYSSPFLPSLYPKEPIDQRINGLMYVCYFENYVGAQSIADIIKDSGVMSEVETVKMIENVTQALNIYSQDKIVHRDVKPQNIVYSPENDRYVLIDGGVHLAPYNTSITSGYIPGTAIYYSPEQAGGQRRSLDSRSDLFSLGITAYEALTGKHPFGIGARSQDDFNNNRTNALFPSLTTGLFTERTVKIVHKLLQRYPHNRYRNPATLLLEFNEGEQ